MDYALGGVAGTVVVLRDHLERRLHTYGPGVRRATKDAAVAILRPGQGRYDACECTGTHRHGWLTC